MSDQTPSDPPCAPTLSQARQSYVALLLGLVGLTSPDPAYLALIAPDDPPAKQLEWAKVSDCIYVALGAQEAFFVCGQRGPNAGAPQLVLERRAGGTPMSFGGAMRPGTKADPPGAGDAVWYGKSAAVNSEHVEHVTDARWTSASVLVIEVVAGGERVLLGDNNAQPAGSETVKALTRTLDWNGAHFVDRSTGRAIIGVVDCDALAARLGLQ